MDGFEATFELAVDRATAWRHLTERPGWLPGFDSAVTVVDEVEGAALTATKDSEPCAGTTIHLTLEDAGTGTRITVVQSGFGDLGPLRDVMAVGWDHIVADLELALATGLHAGRHLGLEWPDFGAEVVACDGGLRLGAIRPETLADRLGLREGDLLLVLAGAPMTAQHDLQTALRVLDGRRDVGATWVRDGELVSR